MSYAFHLKKKKNLQFSGDEIITLLTLHSQSVSPNTIHVQLNDKIARDHIALDSCNLSEIDLSFTYGDIRISTAVAFLKCFNESWHLDSSYRNPQ